MSAIGTVFPLVAPASCAGAQLRSAAPVAFVEGVAVLSGLSIAQTCDAAVIWFNASAIRLSIESAPLRVRLQVNIVCA